MNHAGKIVAGEDLKDNVYVIRHDAPGEEPVSLFMETAQGVGGLLGENGILKMAAARAGIQKLLDDRSGEMLKFPSLVGTERAMELVCGADYCLPLRFNAVEDCFRQGISETESHEVRSSFAFPMRETTTIADVDFAEAGASRPRDSRRDAGATVGRALFAH